jgi:hypothetical protein
MGFFDRLFGRGKDVAEDVGQEGEEAFDTARDKVTGDGGEETPPAPEPPQAPPTSEPPQAPPPPEQR